MGVWTRRKEGLVASERGRVQEVHGKEMLNSREGGRKVQVGGNTSDQGDGTEGRWGTFLSRKREGIAVSGKKRGSGERKVEGYSALLWLLGRRSTNEKFVGVWAVTRNTRRGGGAQKP